MKLSTIHYQLSILAIAMLSLVACKDKTNNDPEIGIDPLVPPVQLALLNPSHIYSARVYIYKPATDYYVPVLGAAPQQDTLIDLNEFASIFGLTTFKGTYQTFVVESYRLGEHELPLDDREAARFDSVYLNQTVAISLGMLGDTATIDSAY
jgi:hypothetical protein